MRVYGWLGSLIQFEDNVAHKEMLTKVYKELMILGFIAFAVGMRIIPTAAAFFSGILTTVVHIHICRGAGDPRQGANDNHLERTNASVLRVL